MAQAKRGTGTVFKLPDGRYKWQGFFIDNTGKRHRPSKIFNTEREALKFQAEQIDNVVTKKAAKSKDLTFEQVFDLWKEAVKDKKIKISETTRKNSIQNINKHLLPIMGKYKMKNVGSISLRRYFNRLADNGTSEKTIYNIYTDFKKIVKFALKEGIIYEDPIADSDLEVKQPRAGQRPVNVMTFNEYKAITENEENKKSFYYNHIVFLAETGLRVEELAIKEKDCFLSSSGVSYIVIDKAIVRSLNNDDKTSSLRIVNEVKNESSVRRVPLNSFAKSALERQIAYNKSHHLRATFVFSTSHGTMLEKRNLLRALHSMCKNAGVDKKGLHSLRKMYINNALKNGITPFDLAKVTGHSVQTMFKYYHDIDDDLLKSIADATEGKK